MFVLLFIAYKIGNSEVTVYQFVVCYFTTHEHLRPDCRCRTFTHEDEYKKALQLLALAAQQKDYEQRKVG